MSDATSGGRLAYDIEGAADMASLSPSLIRRAIKRDGEDASEPRLRAKLVGNKYLIEHDALADWLRRLPDS